MTHNSSKRTNGRCLSATFLFLVLALGGRAEAQDGLIGYWPFDAGGYDVSAEGCDLNLVNGTGLARGLLGQALDLHNNGSQYAVSPYIYYPHNVSVSAFTIQVWVNFNNTYREQTLIEKFFGSNGPGWTITKLDGGRLHFWANPAVAIYSAPLQIPSGRWHQIVVRRSETLYQMIYDGTIVAEGASQEAVPETDMPLLIGKRNDYDGRDFAVDGKIDEVAIWSRALSGAEIAYLYNGGLGNPASSLSVHPSVEGIMTDLGTLGGDSSEARGINDRGQIVGWSETGAGYRHAFIWENGVMTDLGTLGGTSSEARGINEYGQVVGYSSIEGSGDQAFLWEDGAITDLGRGQACGINDRGQVVGSFGCDEHWYRYPFLWENGVRTPLSGLAYASGINDGGQVVGGTIGFMLAMPSTPLIWENGAITALNQPFHKSYGRGINNRGQISGVGEGNAWLWENGRVTNLGDLGGKNSDAHGINDRGQVVGSSRTAAGDIPAFIWENGVITDMGTLGGFKSQAYAINNLRQVVGSSRTAAGTTHAFLWEAFPRNYVNSLVTFAPLSSTYRTVTDTSGCPNACVGKFTFIARLTSKLVERFLYGVTIGSK